MMMNNLPKWKLKLIKFIAGDEPIILNLCILPQNLPASMKAVIMIPHPDTVRTCASWSDDTFLVPTRNVNDGILEDFGSEIVK